MAEPEKEMRNPFRSEADAFRILVMIMVAAAIVIAATIVIGSWLGAILAVLAFALGLYSAAGWLRVGLGERTEDDQETAIRPPEAPGGDASQAP